MIKLISCIFLFVAVTSGLQFANVPDGYYIKVCLSTILHVDDIGTFQVHYVLFYQNLETYDCRWLCDNDGDHWLDFLECNFNEIAVGTCGVDNRASCE